MLTAMTRIDFFEMRGPRWDLFLCGLVERAWDAGERVYLWADSEAEARRLDELLWTFRDDAFVPHVLWQRGGEVSDPVAVGWRPGNPNRATCLALARPAGPGELAGFPRVIDLAPVDMPDRLGPARERFKACRDAGLQVFFHRAPPPAA